MIVGVDPGVPGSPIGTKEWADYVRNSSVPIVVDAVKRPADLKRIHDFIVTHRAWSLMNKPDGSCFRSVEEFVEHERPWGWGRPYAQVRALMATALADATVTTPAGKVAVEPEKALALAEVPEARQGERVDLGEEGTSSPGGLKCPTTGHDIRLARIARDASGDTKDLFRAGLMSERTAAALSPAKKTPEKAARIVEAEKAAADVVKAHGVPASPKAKKEVKRAVDVAVRTALGVAPESPVDKAWKVFIALGDAGRAAFLLRLQDWKNGGAS